MKSHTRLLLVLMCVLTLGLRITGAHLHICLDGLEPPSALHLHADNGLHHADESHNDVDVSLAGQPLFKEGGLDLDLLVVVAFDHDFIVQQPQRAAPAGPELRTVVILPSSFLRPPLRGPPLRISSV